MGSRSALVLPKYLIPSADEDEALQGLGKGGENRRSWERTWDHENPTHSLGSNTSFCPSSYTVSTVGSLYGRSFYLILVLKVIYAMFLAWAYQRFLRLYRVKSGVRVRQLNTEGRTYPREKSRASEAIPHNKNRICNAKKSFGRIQVFCKCLIIIIINQLAAASLSAGLTSTSVPNLAILPII